MHTAATPANTCNALRRALFNVATTRTNRATPAIWPKCIAMSAAVADQRNMCFVHARRLYQIEPRVMGKLQARFWWQQADALRDALHMGVDRH